MHDTCTFVRPARNGDKTKLFLEQDQFPEILKCNQVSASATALQLF